jgi:DNA-binding CsgD family transcriptional regulator
VHNKEKMKIVSDGEYKGVSSAIEIINSSTTLEQFVHHSFLAIDSIIPCDIINYTEVNAPDNLFVWKSNVIAPNPETIASLSQCMFEHPSVAYHFNTGKIKSLMISDFYSKRQFHATRLYNEVYRVFVHTEYEVGTPIWLDQSCINCLVLGRSSKDFSEADRSMLDYIRPYLMQAYARVQILELMNRLTQSYPEGLVVVNREGEVISASENVWWMIARYFNISFCHRILPSTINKWISRERSNIGTGLNTINLSTPLTVRENGRKLALHFIWGTAQYNLFLVEENNIDLNSQLSDKSTALTNRENQILAYLCEGKTNAEIASSLSLSSLTVKKHLDNIYKKLQVHRRSAAVARLFNGNISQDHSGNGC